MECDFSFGPGIDGGKEDLHGALVRAAEERELNAWEKFVVFQPVTGCVRG